MDTDAAGVMDAVTGMGAATDTADGAMVIVDMATAADAAMVELDVLDMVA